MYKIRGFTLIELMVILLVVGVLIALALPSFRDLIERKHLGGAVEAVVQQLRYAKDQSVKRSIPIVVDISANNTKSWALGITDDSECWTLSDPSTCLTWGCDSTKTSATDSAACVIEYDNDRADDYDGDGDNKDPVLMRLVSADFSDLVMKGSGGNAPSFGTVDGPGECNTKSATEACFEPIRGLARQTADPSGHIQMKTENYTLQLEVDMLGAIRICKPKGEKYIAGYEEC